MSANPIRAKLRDGSNRVAGHYCEKISAGCAACYASRMQPRFGLPQFPGHGKRREDVDVYLDEAELMKLVRARKLAGKRVFVCDMSDLFGAWVPDEWIDKLFAVFALRPDVTFQVLTKRPDRMAEYATRTGKSIKPLEVAARTFGYTLQYQHPGGTLGLVPWPLPNVWLGTSVENQQTADERIPHLLKCRAAVRFLSMEPLIGPVDLNDITLPDSDSLDALTGEVCNGQSGCLIDDEFPPLDWVIVGGESGGSARPCRVEWIRGVVTQSQAAGVPVFVKQLGSWPCLGADEYNREVDGPKNWLKFTLCCGRIKRGSHDELFSVGLRDSKGGEISEWPEDLRVREFPFAREASR
jgi:protein gp37